MEIMSLLPMLFVVLGGTALPLTVFYFVLKALSTRITKGVDAYVGESARIAAQYTHIEKSVAMTVANERARNSLAAREVKKAQKREMYLDLLKTLGAVVQLKMEVKKFGDLISEVEALQGQERYREELTLRWKNAHTDVRSEFAAFMRLYNTAPLVLPENVCDFLAQIGIQYGEKDSDHSVDTQKKILLLHSAISKLTDLAKADLGFDAESTTAITATES